MNNGAKTNHNITNSADTETELKFKNVLLSTQQETSIEGILVVNENGKIISSNKRFAEIWGIPPSIIESGSDEKALQYVLDKLVNPEEFLKKVKYLYGYKNEKSQDDIALKDGRLLDRYSAPLLDANKKYYGRIWYFHDITERKKAAEALEEKLKEIEKINRLLIGRELKMAELKKEIKNLKAKLGSK